MGLNNFKQIRIVYKDKLHYKDPKVQISNTLSADSSTDSVDECVGPMPAVAATKLGCSRAEVDPTGGFSTEVAA